jgi:pimeloyl-ACP methyl ester carboxylesterase
MANIVLVHGAWHGGWCYRDTAAILRAKGHNVFTPTLSGNGMYKHNGNQSITLETHVRDVCGLIEAEELDNVILLGHSYGGMVITAAADRIASKIKQLIYLDAFVPEDRQSLMDLLSLSLPKDASDFFLGAFYGSSAAEHSMMMAPVPAAAFGIKPENHAWVDRRCVPQALATFKLPVLLTGAAANTPKLFILADGWDPSPFRYFAAKHTGRPSWTVTKLGCSHDVMVDMPNELAAEILKVT